MRTISLSKGYEAFVDDEDYDWLSQWTWIADPGASKATMYAKRPGQSTSWVQMHVVIMDPPVGMTVDHRNFNGLDNQRSNLRLATRSQQAMNRLLRADNTSGYKGVTWDAERGKWRARIMVEGKSTTVGRYREILDAVRAYDDAARELFGEFAVLNLGAS